MVHRHIPKLLAEKLWTSEHFSMKRHFRKIKQSAVINLCERGIEKLKLGDEFILTDTIGKIINIGQEIYPVNSLLICTKLMKDIDISEETKPVKRLVIEEW